MTFVKKIALVHFKNYVEKEFTFSKRIVCIYGNNGSGKTSILDAIHYLCFTKSYFAHLDSINITKGTLGMSIHGVFTDQKEWHLKCVLREQGKKEFSLNQEFYTQFSKHVGKFPCVFITPDDTALITDGSEQRRRFLDAMISQTNASYMEHLIMYSKFLQQRNSLLKQWPNSHQKDLSLLSIYNQKLHEVGTLIYKARIVFFKEYELIVKRIYSELSQEQEEIALYYHSQLASESLIDLLDRNQEKDIITQRSNYGIHKDDLIFSINEMPLKQSASQGQRKSFLFALKLAQFEFIKSSTHKNPILLLDDIFEKLDEFRCQQLIQYVVQNKAQVFITDTHKQRLETAFEHNLNEVEFIKLL